MENERVAVVTGGAGGIGLAVTRRLAGAARAWWRPTRMPRRSRASRIELGPSVLAVHADVSTEAGVETYMEAAIGRFGRVDGYHLNAGIAGAPAFLPDASVDEFDRVMAVNVRGVFLGLQAAFRQYAAQGSPGSVVLTASICSYGGGADLVAYHTSKHALVGLMRSAAVYGGPLGIRVNAVAPGVVPTNLLPECGNGHRHCRAGLPCPPRAASTRRHDGGGRGGRRVPARRCSLVRDRERLLGGRRRGRRQPG